MTTPRQTRSEQLLRVVEDFERVLVITHDNPDPDAIASSWALSVLIRRKLGRAVRVVGGGDIVRAENRRLVELLAPPIELVDDVEIHSTTAAILVDCSFTADNHLLAKEGVRPVAVIDHHVPARGRRLRTPFRDVRPRVAAAASITASYLREQRLEPSARLATALSYAIRTETRGSQVQHARLDRSVLRWLAQYLNPEWIADIESAPLPRVYYSDLHRSLATTVLHEDVAFCLLPQAHGAEIVGEVADLLIRCETVRAVLCGAIVHGDLVMSVRTAIGQPDAPILVERTLADLGSGGGHAQRAGGKVAAAHLKGLDADTLREEMLRRWLAACRVEPATGSMLVAPPADDETAGGPAEADVM